MFDTGSSNQELDLQVSLVGRKVEIEGGFVCVGGVSCEVEGVEHSVITDVKDPAWLRAYLVHDKSNDVLDILIDEVGGPVWTSPYVFSSGGPYKLLAKILNMYIPPDTEDLNDCDVTIYRIVKNPPSEGIEGD